MRVLVAVCFAVVVSATSLVDCGNGALCPGHTSCVSSQPGTGLKWACAPMEKAEICTDKRYSCPSKFACNSTAHMCENGDVAVPMMTNGYAVQMFGAPQTSICSVLKPALPSFCYCADGASSSSTLKCPVSILGDEVTVEIDLIPCGNPAEVAFIVSDKKFNINYKIADITAGHDETIDIPGLSLAIPGVPVSAGVVLDVKISGNIDSLTLDIGLDACVDLPFIGKECGSKLLSALPIWLLDQTFNFGSVCTGAQKQLTNSTV